MSGPQKSKRVEISEKVKYVEFQIFRPAIYKDRSVVTKHFRSVYETTIFALKIVFSPRIKLFSGTNWFCSGVNTFA